MAELLHSDREGDNRYRVAETDRRFLVSMRTLRGPGTWLASEWQHQNQETADACLEAVRALNAAWRAIEAGPPSDVLLCRAEALSSPHTQRSERLNDHPLVVAEVRTFHETKEPEL